MRTLNNFIIIEEITEEKTANGLMIAGASAQKIRAKKAKVITAGDAVGVKDGDIIFYDSARKFTLVDKEFPTPVTVIRISDIIVVI